MSLNTTQWVAPCAGATIGELIAHFVGKQLAVDFLNKFPRSRRTSLAILKPPPVTDYDVIRITKGPILE